MVKSVRAGQAVIGGLSRFYVILAIGVIVGCNDNPSGPKQAEWQYVAYFPAGFLNITALTVTSDEIFAAAEKNPVGLTQPPAFILAFKNNVIKPVYESPYKPSSFSSISNKDGSVWAAGFKEINGEWRPYVEILDGTAWRELTVPSNIDAINFSRVCVLGADNACFQGNTGHGGQGIYSYDEGVWSETLRFNDSNPLYFCGTNAGRLFAYSARYSPNDPKGYTYVSDDGGRTWQTEILTLPPTPYFIPPYRISAIAPAGNGLALLGEAFTSQNPDAFSYQTIILRDDAPPGAGRYEVAFLAPHGPYFYGVGDMAFRSREDGRAVGGATSVLLRNGDWLMETAGMDWNPCHETLTYGNGAYWVVCYVAGEGLGEFALFRAY